MLFYLPTSQLKYDHFTRNRPVLSSVLQLQLNSKLPQRHLHFRRIFAINDKHMAEAGGPIQYFKRQMRTYIWIIHLIIVSPKKKNKQHMLILIRDLSNNCDGPKQPISSLQKQRTPSWKHTRCYQNKGQKASSREENTGWRSSHFMWELRFLPNGVLKARCTIITCLPQLQANLTSNALQRVLEINWYSNLIGNLMYPLITHNPIQILLYTWNDKSDLSSLKTCLYNLKLTAAAAVRF